MEDAATQTMPRSVTALLLGGLLAGGLAEAATPPLAPLYGLIRVHQMPSLPALVAVDPGTGELTLVDQSSSGKAGLATTAGTGDLVRVTMFYVHAITARRVRVKGG